MTVQDERDTVPVLLGIAGSGLLLWTVVRNRWSARDPRDHAASREPSSARPTTSGWQWPVPLWGDYSPVISDGWGSRRTTLDGRPAVHRGVDLMYPRKSLDDQAAYPVRSAGGSKWHFAPVGVPVLAARAGRVVYAQRGARGHAVTIRHADGWTTFYQHLANVNVAVGEAVILGQVLGELGGDPTQKPPLRHLHFELRDPAGSPIDPKPHLLSWPRVRSLSVFDGAVAAVVLPPPRYA